MASIDTIINRQLLRWEMAKKQAAEEREILLPPPAVVTVSREAGSRGSHFAFRLAEELEYQWLHREVIEAICESSGYRKRVVESLDTRFQNDLHVLVEAMFTGQSVDHGDYYRHLFSTVLSMARLGGVVLVGRGGNHILGPLRGFHIRVVAQRAQRIANLVKYKDVSAEIAEADMDQADRERRELVSRMFGADIDDPAHYDLVVNFSFLDIEEMISPTIAAIRAKFQRLASIPKH